MGEGLSDCSLPFPLGRFWTLNISILRTAYTPVVLWFLSLVPAPGHVRTGQEEAVHIPKLGHDDFVQ